MDKRLWILSFLALAPLGSYAQTKPAPSTPAPAPAQAPKAAPPAQAPAKANGSIFNSGPAGSSSSSQSSGDDGGGFQMPAGPPPANPTPWRLFKLPKKTMTLNFKNASADSVLNAFSKASGITIIKDPAFTGTITLSTPKAVSLSDAFNMLNEYLKLRNFELQKKDNLLEVVSTGSSNNGGRPDFSQFRNMFGGGGGRNQPVLKYYPIQYASASAVAKTINDVFSTSTTPNNNPFGGFRGFQQQIQLGGGAQTPTNPNQPTAHASADDFSNTVIVNAVQSVQDQIAEMLKAIDKQADEPFKSVVYKLKYASSDDLASVIQNVLASNAPTGRGGGAGNVDPFQRFQQAARLGSAQASFGTVVSEPRSNSLVVTATPENQTLVNDVIDKLDQPIKFEDSANVISLSNAKADQVAYVINQAFQSKIANTSTTTLNSYGAGTSGSTSLNRFTTIGGTRLTTPGGLADPDAASNGLALNTGGGGGVSADSATSVQGAALAGAARPNPQANGRQGAATDPGQANDPVYQAEQAMVQQALQDPSIDPLAVQTNIAVQGGFFNRFGGGSQNSASQQTQPIQTHGENGDITNIHNLTGNVTVIPDINSNSVIVVTNPDNMTIIREILDQLDRTPAQVMIQAIIVEATLDQADKFGVEWSYLGGKFGQIGTGFGLKTGVTTPNPTATIPVAGLTDEITNGNLTAFLQAVGQDSRDRVLATPRIFATNNNAAEINISQSVPYETGSTILANGQPSYSYGFLPVGIVLDVIPQVTANGMVTMQVQQSANSVVSYSSVTGAPLVNERSANTVVSVKDGQTIILGGIMETDHTSTVQKIPLLGDIPIIGNLFRSTVKEDVKTELLIFLTPHVIYSPADADKLYNKTKEEMPKLDQNDLNNFVKQQQNSTTGNPPKEGGH